MAIMEDLEVLGDRIEELDPGFANLRLSGSICIRDQNDSMTALSKQSPTKPIDGSSPESIARA